MEYLLKKFKHEVGSMLEPMGFKLKNKWFYVRITEEKVCQVIELCKRPFISLKFMSRPLFIGKSSYSLSSGAWIGKEWYNFKKDEAIYNEIISEMVEITKTELIPFFEKTETIEGAYQAEVEGNSMGRDSFLAKYKAREGDCKPITEYLKWWIEDSKNAEKANVASYRKNGFFTEEEIQQYSKRMEKERLEIKERLDFFTNSSPEAIAEYFSANEEEALIELKWKFE